MTKCEATYPGGRVVEETRVEWYSAIVVVTAALGAWIAVAGLLGTMAWPRSLRWVIALAGVFLVATALFFV